MLLFVYSKLQCVLGSVYCRPCVYYAEGLVLLADSLTAAGFKSMASFCFKHFQQKKHCSNKAKLAPCPEHPLMMEQDEKTIKQKNKDAASPTLLEAMSLTER